MTEPVAMITKNDVKGLRWIEIRKRNQKKYNASHHNELSIEYVDSTSCTDVKVLC
jgi:hypothetical protein